jgi:hypothetical protein
MHRVVFNVYNIILCLMMIILYRRVYMRLSSFVKKAAAALTLNAKQN